MIVLNYPQGSEDWLRARCGVATASRFSDAIKKLALLDDRQAAYVNAIKAGKAADEAMAAAGYKAKPRAAAIDDALAGKPLWRWSGEAESYASLLALETIAREPLDDTYITYAMRRGRELEPRAREVYEVRTGALVQEVSLILTDDSLFGYSADGMVDDDGLVEIKCPMSPDKLVNVWANPDTAHLEYFDQMQGGLWITGRKWCDLVVYCPWLSPVKKDLFVKRIFRDDNYIERMESDLLDFRRLVDSRLEMLRAPAKMSGKPKDAPEVSPNTGAETEPPWKDVAAEAAAAPTAPTPSKPEPKAATSPSDIPEELF